VHAYFEKDGAITGIFHFTVLTIEELGNMVKWCRRFDHYFVIDQA
jgi:hypothetical protein